MSRIGLRYEEHIQVLPTVLVILVTTAAVPWLQSYTMKTRILPCVRWFARGRLDYLADEPEQNTTEKEITSYGPVIGIKLHTAY